MSTTPDAAVAAFRTATREATKSSIVRLERPALDIHDESGALYRHLEAVRASLLKGYKEQGATVGVSEEAFRARLGERLSEELVMLLEYREAAGYLFGLAVGLTLGRGGPR